MPERKSGIGIFAPREIIVKIDTPITDVMFNDLHGAIRAVVEVGVDSDYFIVEPKTTTMPEVNKRRKAEGREKI